MNALLSILGLVSVAAAQPAELHVIAAGTADAPHAAAYSSLPEARDAILAMKESGAFPEGGVTVWVHGGAYALPESFTLTEADSGTAEGSVVYRAQPGEEVRLYGGREIPPSAFALVADPGVLARLAEEARAEALCADLSALGLSDFGVFPDRFEQAVPVSELFFNDTRMQLARWPNEGWAEIASVLESGPAPWRNHTSDKHAVFQYAGDQPVRWVGAPEVLLEGYWCFDWSCETVRAGAIDPAARTITLAADHHYGLGSGNPAPRRFCAINLLEELDAPGEYYIDRARGMLYFRQPAALDGARIVLSTNRGPVIDIRDASHITLRGFTIETGVGDGIRITGGVGVRVEACRVRNTGQNGIVVDGGEAHAVVACDICDTGMGGLIMGGGDRKTLHPSRHEAVNNHIFRISRRMRTHAYNVQLSGVGVLLRHNLIHDAPHQAVCIGGNDHLIELNEIHHSGMESDDCGAFYMGRNPSERGTIIRDNYWHHIGSTMAHGSCAIYFDDGAGGQLVSGNVFYQACGGNFGAVFVHGGHDNRVINNIFVDCKRAIGAVPWEAPRWKEWLTGELWQTRLLQEVDITRAPYIERYPELAGFMESDQRPRMNLAERNVVFQCASFIEGNWEEHGNLVTESDPGFVDAAVQDFALRDDAAVFAAIPGFVPVPFHDMGLYVDELRPALPE